MKNYQILIQLDANAKLGSKFFSKDPHSTTENGRLFYELAERQNLNILKMDELCSRVLLETGNKNWEEKSIIGKGNI